MPLKYPMRGARFEVQALALDGIDQNVSDREVRKRARTAKEIQTCRGKQGVVVFW